MLFDLRSFSDFLSHFLSPNPQWLFKKFNILKDPDVSFLLSHAHRKDRKHQVWNVPVSPPPLNKSPSMLMSFHPCLSHQGSYPTICLLDLISSHIPRCTARTIVSHGKWFAFIRSFPGYEQRVDFPSWDQSSWRKVSGQKENEYTGKKGGKKKPRKENLTCLSCAFISKRSNLYIKHVTKHQLLY